MYKWMEILDDIITGITNGEYRSDVQLPSENMLAEKYNVSRYDVRKSYERLAEMGYIHSIQGKGRYYKSKHDKIELILKSRSVSNSFTSKMKEQGYDLKTINIDFTELSPSHKIREELNVSEKGKIYKLSRLRIIDDVPSALHISYVSDEIFKSIKNDGPNIISIFNYYKQHGYENFYYKESDLQTMLPTKYERKILNCPSLVPIILLESKCIDSDSHQILDVTKRIYRGDRFVCRFSSGENNQL